MEVFALTVVSITTWMDVQFFFKNLWKAVREVIWQIQWRKHDDDLKNYINWKINHLKLVNRIHDVFEQPKVGKKQVN